MKTWDDIPGWIEEHVTDRQRAVSEMMRKRGSAAFEACLGGRVWTGVSCSSADPQWSPAWTRSCSGIVNSFFTQAAWLSANESLLTNFPRLIWKSI